MEKVVSAATANRNFSQLLRAVREGEIYIVTAHGTPVAKIMPVEAGESISRKARSTLLKRLRSQPVVNIGRWRREELYEESK